jgi:glycosyltransferase involved in cell wall biosynthesis
VALLAYNDAAHVESVLSGWGKVLDGLGREYELILVDDGSSDGTPDKVEALRERFGRLQVVRRPAHQGQGAALRSALAEARYPLFFYTLCRPEYRPADLGRLLQKRGDPAKPDLDLDQVHILSGYRAGVPLPRWFRVLGWLWRLLARVVFSYNPGRLPGWLGWRRHLGRVLVRAFLGVRYQDVACPFRLFRREIFQRIPIQSDGPFAHVEVIAKANFLGCVLGEEIPLNVRPPQYRGDEHLFWRDGMRVFRNPDFGPAVPPADKVAPPSPPTITPPPGPPN